MKGRTEIYGWMERLLCHHEYPLQKRRAKGLLRVYVERMTGFSQAQSTRLIGDYVKVGRIAARPSARPRYQRHYTAADIALLAAVDGSVIIGKITSVASKPLEKGQKVDYELSFSAKAPLAENLRQVV